MALFSTYQQVVDDVLSDINEDDKLSGVGNTAVMTMIQRWEQNLSQRIDMRGQTVINLLQNQADYQIDQLPERIEEFISVTRVINGFLRDIQIVNLERLVQANQYDTDRYIIWSDYDCPMMVAPWTKDNKRYLKVYPVPVNDTQITCFYRVNLLARDLMKKGLTNEISVPMEYEEILKMAVKSQIYMSILKDGQQATAAMQMYENLLANHDRNMPETARILVTYR